MTEILNPQTILEKYFKSEEFHIDYEDRVIYVKDLYLLSQLMGYSWSRLATEVEWCGWKVAGRSSCLK